MSGGDEMIFVFCRIAAVAAWLTALLNLAWFLYAHSAENLLIIPLPVLAGWLAWSVANTGEAVHKELARLDNELAELMKSHK